MSKHYLIQVFGDLPRTWQGKSVNNTIHHELDEALSKLKTKLLERHKGIRTNCWCNEEGKCPGWDTVFDCEDDRVLIWEVLDTGHKKVVWHASGWHWDADEFGLDQGKLPGVDLSLYHISAMDL